MKIIDLSKVPVPDIIQQLDFESTFQSVKQILIDIDPSYEQALTLESEPLVKLLQVFAYREIYLISKINDSTRANMLASSSGKDLEAIAARYNIERMLISEPDSSASPPVPAVFENDESLKRRVQLAFDGLNTAGSYDSYIFHALSSSALVKDAVAISPAPCEVDVYILSFDADGSPDSQLIDKVSKYFATDSSSTEFSKVRPIGDRLTIRPAGIEHFEVSATVVMKRGPDSGAVMSRASKNLDKYLDSCHMIGEGVARSGIHAALHVDGVQSVTIQSPAADLPALPSTAYWCSSKSVEVYDE